MLVFKHYYTEANVYVTVARECVAEPKVILGYCSLQYNSSLCCSPFLKIFPIILKKRKTDVVFVSKLKRGDNLSVDCSLPLLLLHWYIAGNLLEKNQDQGIYAAES